MRITMAAEDCAAQWRFSYAKTVQISDCITNGNDFGGVLVLSKGNVTIKNLGSQETQNYYGWGMGLYVDNCLYDEGMGMCTGSGTVTLSG